MLFYDNFMVLSLFLSSFQEKRGGNNKINVTDIDSLRKIKLFDRKNLVSYSNINIFNLVRITFLLFQLDSPLPVHRSYPPAQTHLLFQ